MAIAAPVQNTRAAAQGYPPMRYAADARFLPMNDIMDRRSSVRAAAIDRDPPTVEVPLEFHRRMAAIIDAVQTGVWNEGVHDLLGYATDYDFGQQRGFQTLVLKSRRRSAYVRLDWDTVMGDAAPDRQIVDEAIKSAINELR